MCEYESYACPFCRCEKMNGLPVKSIDEMGCKNCADAGVKCSSHRGLIALQRHVYEKHGVRYQIKE